MIWERCRLADYKNQHFVPKCYFKPFSVGADASAVNMYLINHGRPVFGASIKGQCAKPYLYGHDGELERLLGQIEGAYGGLVSKLAGESHQVTPGDEWLLRCFTLFQSHRTAEQIARTLARMTEMASFFQASEEAHGNQWNPVHNPTKETAMKELLLSAYEQTRDRILDDLKVVIVRNRTSLDFVTSDDPAVMTNRWLLQRKSISTFGTNAAGLLMFLPLAPKLLALIYDPAVYNVAAKSRGRVDLNKESDVLAFNQHQYMRAVSAVYFQRAEDADEVSRHFEAAKIHRPSRWDRFTVAKFDGTVGQHSKYVVGTPSEIAKENAILFHLAREWPLPPSWPSIIRYRANARGYSKGRIIVRRAHVPNLSGSDSSLFRKVG
jgi:Protein of unknown function (DUF4238)